MKKLIFLIVLLPGINLFGQTDSCEKAAILKKLTSKELTEKEFTIIWAEWKQKNAVQKYPDLPLDQNGKVHYIFIKEFIGINKEKLFNRTLEWLSINYGLVPVNIYTNLIDGKIIFRNNLDLFKNNSCAYTANISIIDDKIKVELISIMFQAYHEGDYSSGIPDKTSSFDINGVYPIALKKTSEWNYYLLLLRTTNELFNTETNNLWDYILSYDTAKMF